jgi:tetratricopeptide (TPR) repeat protein
MECLSDRLGQLDAILDVLRSADADLIRHAAAVVNDLPALEPCRDVASLRATPPLPDDPELRERVAATRQEIARAHALAVVRRFGPAIDILEGLQETVERLGVQSLSAEQLYELGWVRLRHVGGEPAQTALEQSYWLARSNGLEVLSVKAATKLAYLVGYIDHAEREGLQWARHAQVDLDRRGRDLELEAQLANVRGAIFLGAQRFDHAKDELARGLALREAYKGPDDPWLAAGLRNLATVHALQSEWDPALELMERAMRLCALGLGSDHPETIETRRQYGQHLRSAGHYARARAELEPALADLERVLGEGHPSVAEAVAELGTLARVQGHYLEAIAHLERALQLETALREADALEIGYVRMELATALHGAGALATAREQFERALAILRAHLGDGHDNIAATSINLGHVVRAQGDLDRAEEMYREALQIREAIFEPDNVALATPLESLAVVAQARGRTRDALALGERALALREREGADHPKLVATLTIVADAELSLGQIGAALAHAERAVRIHEARGGEADTLAEAKAVLARTRSAVGNR